MARSTMKNETKEVYKDQSAGSFRGTKWKRVSTRAPRATKGKYIETLFSTLPEVCCLDVL